MENLNKKALQKQLNKAYTKRFKQLNKGLINTTDAGLLIFVEHLKYLRDCYILNSLEKPTTTDSKLNSISIAINEFEIYQKNKKEFHWRNFCEFVKLNTEEWLKLNDSI